MCGRWGFGVTVIYDPAPRLCNSRELVQERGCSRSFTLSRRHSKKKLFSVFSMAIQYVIDAEKIG